jgi:thiol-disulfide isomerase/thioredoxin
MTPRRALILGVVLFATSVMWAATRYARDVRAGHGGAPDAASGEHVTVQLFKNPAPVGDFAVADLDGRPITAASLKGKVTIINFWATWCGPCRAEIPDLVALQDKYRDHLQVVGISEDEAPPETVKRFAAQYRVNYPIVMITPELEKTFGSTYAIPTSFILDREGRIVQKHVGMLQTTLTEAETSVLAGLPVNASIERVDQAQGLKLDNGAQATEIPGVDLAKLSVEQRADALQKLNAQPCTCGCDLTVARCRVDDPNCGVSLPLARQIVQQITNPK